MKHFLILFFSFLPFAGITQSKTDFVDYEQLNTQFLEFLAKSKIDQYRIMKGLDKLRSDSMLLLPACDHSEFMLSNNKLTHFQKRGAKHDPQRRFDFFGIDNVQAGENVLYIPINTLLKVEYQKDPLEIKTYEDLAEAVAKAWRHSKPHYANILTEEFTVTALCIRIDKKTEMLWATQAFGQVVGEHELTKTNESFPYESFYSHVKKKLKKTSH